MPLTKFGGDGPQRFPRQKEWLVHHHLPVMAVSWVILEFYAVIVSFTEISSWKMFPMIFIGQLMLIWAMSEASRHAMRTCERCIWQGLTEEGAEKATENINHLRRYHWWLGLRPRTVVSAIFAGLVLLLILPTNLFFVFVGAANGLYLYNAYSTRMHSRYQRWCPWCRGWDDGDWSVPEPDPDPTGQEIPTPPKHIVLR